MHWDFKINTISKRLATFKVFYNLVFASVMPTWIVALDSQ
jgi:hypothetical protein